MVKLFEQGRGLRHHLAAFLEQPADWRGAPAEEGRKAGRKGAALPPGFDPASYLDINHDIARTCEADPDPLAAAGRHYASYGRAERRRVLRDGAGIADFASRLLSPSEREDWLAALRRRAPTAAAQGDLLRSHPRAGWLDAGFSAARYMEQCPEVTAAIDRSEEAVFHFLEFGLEQGLHGWPSEWEPDIVAALYGLEPEPGISGPQVYHQLRRAGHHELLLPLNEAEFWAAMGLPGRIMAQIFDHQYYHAMATRDGAEPPGIDRPACIRDFALRGLKALRPIGPDHVFDPAFYRDLNAGEFGALLPAGRGAPDQREAQQLYDHWLRRGLVRDRAPNLDLWARTEHGLRVPVAVLDQLPAYALTAPELKPEASRVTILRHLLERPAPGLAGLDLRGEAAAAFLVDLGDRLVVTDNSRAAEWVYHVALLNDAGYHRAKAQLADLVQRQGRSSEALNLRRDVPVEAEYGWNSLLLAETYIECGRYAQAAARLSGIRKAVRADVQMRGKLEQLARRLFERIWNNLGPHVEAHGIAGTQAHLTAAMEACTPEFTSVERERRIRRVALIGNDDLFQCKLYRVDQKADQLRAAGFEVQVYSPNHDIDSFLNDIDSFDAAIFFRVAAFPGVIDAIVSAAAHGIVTFYEIDDVVFDTAHFPPPYESYANQISRGDYAAMACGVPLFAHAMSLCDYGIASTATIRELMEPRVRRGRVFEHHNALGRLHMAAIGAGQDRPARAADAPLVIFYGSGTKAHKEDFHEILEPALAEVMRRHPKRVELRLIGHFDDFRHIRPGRDPVRLMEPVWDFEEFCATVAEADINLSVLSPSLLTDAKSEIKWMEAAMFAIPSVVSATRTHRETIEDGVTGMLCETTADFTRALLSLIEDPALRTRIGTAARDTVMERYSIPAMGAGLAAMFDTLRPVPATPKKRLLIVNVFYPPQAIGGATRVVHDNVRLLKEQYGDRYEIDVVCTLEGGLDPYQVEVYAHEGVRVWSISTPGTFELDKQPIDPKMGEIFDRLLVRIAPDLVHFHCIQRLTAAIVNSTRLREIPYVITAHDGWWISPHQFLVDRRGRTEYYDYSTRGGGGLAQRASLLYRPLAGAEHVLAVSEAFGAIYRDCHVPGVITVENGVARLPDCVRSPSASGRVRLAHIGGAQPHKGYHLVRNALMANAYENLELLVVDHALAPGRERIETWGQTPVRIVAKTPQAQISELYARMDVLLAPSTWPESYGLVTREALASGAWVIASDRGAIGSDVVEGQNGYVVDVSTYAALAETLWILDRDPDRYRAPPGVPVSIRTVSEQVDELAALYDRIIAGG